MSLIQHVFIDTKSLGKYPVVSVYASGQAGGQAWYYSATDAIQVSTISLSDPTEHFTPDSSWIPAVGFDGQAPHIFARSNGSYWASSPAQGRTVDLAVGPEYFDQDMDITLFFDIPVMNASGVLLRTERVMFVIHLFSDLDYSCEIGQDGIEVWGDDLSTDAQKILYNSDSISSSLDDIIFTDYGERPGRPEYGSPVPKALWSTITSAKAEDLLDRTIAAITRWEPRVAVDKARSGLNIDRALTTVIVTIPITIRQTAKKVLYRRKFSYGS